MKGEVEKLEGGESIFLWKLKEFSSLDHRVDSSVDSPSFRFCDRKWFLHLYPSGRKNHQWEGYMVLSLYVCDVGPQIEVRYSMGIRTAKGLREMCYAGTKHANRTCAWGIVMERREVLRRRNELLPQDVLTLTVTMKRVDGSSDTVFKNASVQATVETNVTDVSVQATVETNVTDVSVQTAVEESLLWGEKGGPTDRTGVDKIVEDVGKLWLDSDHTDVMLKVRDVEFKAHRTILAARIPVLGAMFQHDTIEKASGVVSIDDCEPEVFKQLLHYIYKGFPRELTAENASALYAVADKYLVSELKTLCTLCMQDTLCLDTFCDTLALSLLHKEDELLKKATDFFSRNMVDVLKTIEWQKFMGEHQTWANEILICATRLTTARYEKEKRAPVDQSTR